MKTILPDPDDGKATASDEVRARPSLFLFTSVKKWYTNSYNGRNPRNWYQI